ncbi:MAG TPA: hypothetical protein GX707_00465 [Epulopiscium sp.]|nr:hypothetical protein [Candidatus Epulonipiscium sp.]
MEIVEITEEEYKIKDISYTIKNDDCIIRWKWPNQVDYVSVVKKLVGQEVDPREAGKLYTKEEYKAQNGYKEKIEHIGKFDYTIYPYLPGYYERTLGKQLDEENKIIIITGKINTYYSVLEKPKWFSNKKLIKITIQAEHSIPKEMFCYVKKKGSYPASKEDGIMFQFIEDIKPGQNKFAEIEVDKDEFIKIFLADGKKFGDIHSLIKI